MCEGVPELLITPPGISDAEPGLPTASVSNLRYPFTRVTTCIAAWQPVDGVRKAFRSFEISGLTILCFRNAWLLSSEAGEASCCH